MPNATASAAKAISGASRRAPTLFESPSRNSSDATAIRISSGRRRDTNEVDITGS